VRKRLGVRVYFALVHQAVLVLVDELDRVLNSDDVVMALAVDLVNHGSQRGGLSRTGRPGHQYQATRLLAELGDDGRKPELLERFDLEGNYAEDRRGGAALIE